MTAVEEQTRTTPIAKSTPGMIGGLVPGEATIIFNFQVSA
jgi:hypothetical protein